MTSLWLFLLLVAVVEVVFGKRTNVIKIKGAGAAFPKSVYSAWMTAYRTYRLPFANVDVTYDAVGSVHGKNLIRSGSVEYAGSDSLLQDADYTMHPGLQMFPTMAGGLVIVYNIPIKYINLSRDDVVGIFNGTVTTWDDPSLVKANPGVDLPHAPIHPVVRSDSSGTTEIFTRALSAFSRAWEETYGVFSVGASHETEVKWNESAVKLYGRRSYGIVDYIREMNFTVGYVSLEAAKFFDLKIARIENRAGKFIKITRKSVQAAMDHSVTNLGTDLTTDLMDLDGDDSYPLSSYTYMIINTVWPEDECKKAVELSRYIEWFHTSKIARRECYEIGFTCLSKSVRRVVYETLFSRWKCGDSSVLDLLEEQKYQELLSTQTWRMPLFVSVPIILILITIFLGYYCYQKYKYYKMMNRDDWDVKIEDILFCAPKSAAETAQGTSVLSITTCTSLDQLVPVNTVLHWPGRWCGLTIGLRLIEVKNLQVINRETRRLFMWMREAVNHENILKFHGLTLLDNERYILSEYCQKGALHDVLKDSKLNLTDSLKFSIGFDVASGVGHLHSLSIIHGSLTSYNCLIDDHWAVKVADWEYYKIYTKSKNKSCAWALWGERLSKERNPADAKHSFWVAPEVLRAEGLMEPTMQCDSYSFAILLQEIFTREDPFCEIFDLLSPTEIHEAIRSNNLRPTHGEGTPILVRQIMECAWADDPTTRPSFDQILTMLKNAHTNRKSVLDNMMEVMEGYTRDLETRIAERSSQSVVLKQQRADLRNMFIPPFITRRIESGQPFCSQVLPVCTLLNISLMNISGVCSALDPNSVTSYLGRVLNIFDSALKKTDIVRIGRSVEHLSLLTGAQNDYSDAKVHELVSAAIEIFSSLTKPVNNCQPVLQIKAAMNTGEATACLTGGAVPHYVVFGPALDTLKELMVMSEANRLLVSKPTFLILHRLGKMKFKMNIPLNDDSSTMTYWLVEGDHVVLDMDPLEERQDKDSPIAMVDC